MTAPDLPAILARAEAAAADQPTSYYTAARRYFRYVPQLAADVATLLAALAERDGELARLRAENERWRKRMDYVVTRYKISLSETELF